MFVFLLIIIVSHHSIMINDYIVRMKIHSSLLTGRYSHVYKHTFSVKSRFLGTQWTIYRKQT